MMTTTHDAPRSTPATTASRVAVGILVIVALFGSDASGNDTPLSETPYNLVVCLQFENDPILTRLYVETVRREVRGQLVNLFGRAATVDVVANVGVVTPRDDAEARTAESSTEERSSTQPNTHWLFNRFSSKDIDRTAITSQNLAPHRESQTAYYFQIDVREGNYNLTFQQMDVGRDIVSDVDTRTTADRLWLSKAICLTVRDTFPAVASISTVKQQAKLEFQAEALQEPDGTSAIQSLLTDEFVMVAYQLRSQADGTTEYRDVANTVLRAMRGKWHTPEVFSNKSNPWAKTSRRIVGFEAVRIPTTRGRLRLHFEDVETGRPMVQGQVFMNDLSFDSITGVHEIGTPNRNGIVTSPTDRPLSHLAFVRLSQGAESNVEIPIPITRRFTERSIRVSYDEYAGKKDTFQRELRFLVQDLQSLAFAHETTRVDANDLNDTKRYEEASNVLSTAITNSMNALASAKKRITRLDETSKELDRENTLHKWARDELDKLETRHDELVAFRTAMSTANKTRDAQDRADVLLNIAKQAERDADFDEAILRYELALAEQPDQPVVKARLAELERAWQTKGTAHAEARDYIANQWKKADVNQLASRLPTAQQSLDTFKRHQDELGAQLIIKANKQHIAEIAGVVELLTSGGTDADKKELEEMTKLSQQVLALSQDANDFISQLPASSPLADAAPAATKPPQSNANDTPASDKPKSLLDDMKEEEGADE